LTGEIESPPRCSNAASDLFEAPTEARPCSRWIPALRTGSARSKTIFCFVLYDASLLRRADVPNLGTTDPTQPWRRAGMMRRCAMQFKENPKTMWSSIRGTSSRVAVGAVAGLVLACLAWASFGADAGATAPGVGKPGAKDAVPANLDGRPDNLKLADAVRAGNLARVEELLAAGASVDSRGRSGETLLFNACKNGNQGAFDLALKYNADVNLGNADDLTPLMAAAYGGQAAMVVELVKRGATTGNRDRIGRTALEYASGRGSVAVVTVLLDAGDDVNRRSRNDLTALMWAAGQGHAEVVDLLLARGADASLRDDRGKDAAMIARDSGHPELMDRLKSPAAATR
jgi:uncharacterized protein